MPDFSIFAGDFNIALDPVKDTKNYIHINNPQARQMLKSQMEQYNLIDIWREFNPDGKKFTWQKYNENKMARLDYFLISASLLPYIQNVDILPGFCSDHSSITLDIDFSKFVRGKGFWKFNNSLIQDPDYVSKVKETIKRVVAQYAIIEGDPCFYVNTTQQILNDFYASSSPETLQYVNIKINSEAFLDILLLEIRRVSIIFAAGKKRDRFAQEQLLLHEIGVLENKLATENQDNNFVKMNADLQAKKLSLEQLYSYQAQGAFVRARAKFKLEGEKPTKLFCSLEKHNAIQKHIPKLVTERAGVKIEISDQASIEEEILEYYKDLFEKKNVDDIDITDFLTSEIASSCPKLSEEQKEKMEGILSVDELTRHIKKTKNNVAPGSSGFSNEFFKFFWIDMKIFIANAINYSYDSGKLSITQRLGIITLIPKGDKDKTFLKNWRPLTLLNSIYKLVSGCIAERMKPHLDTIIHGDQKGFVSGRYIGEAIRTTYDIMQWAKDNNKVGIILLIDFEKAYDSLSFNYIEKCLRFFNFGNCMIKWVNLLLHNFSAVINHCGNISKKFNINRGARQGDPIASYLFIICIEVLAHKLRNEEKISGFKVKNHTHTLEMYADDCTIFLEPNDRNLRNALETLDSFYRISGLKISVTKTKAIWFGKGFSIDQRLCSDLTLDWDTQFRLLGIDFDGSLDNMECNFDSKIKDIEKLLNCWMYRTLTVYGKAVIIKTLALSKLSHLALVLPNLDKKRLKTVENLFFSFLWGNKTDKVARNDTKLNEKAGGLGIVDINSFWSSLKISWIRRILNTSAFWPNILELLVEDVLGYNLSMIDILQLGPNMLSFIGKKFKNSFWKEVFCSIKLFMQGALFCYPEKISQAPIWDNPIFLRNNKPIKKTSYSTISFAVNTIDDFYKPGSSSKLSRAEFENKYDVTISDDTLLECHYIFRTARETLGLNGKCASFYPNQPLLINIVNLTKKGCNVYTRLI